MGSKHQLDVGTSLTGDRTMVFEAPWVLGTFPRLPSLEVA